jgi:hypothetical protein
VQIYAQYNGSSKFKASETTPVTHTTTPGASTTKLSITTDNSTLFGNATGLLARVGSTVNGIVPTGRVVFYDGSTVLGSKAVGANGRARWLASYLYPGTHQLKAVYQGSTWLLSHRSPVRSVAVNWPAFTTTSDGLQVARTIAGNGGLVAGSGTTISVSYALYVNGKFHSAATSSFAMGATPPQAIAGFEEGVTGATAGERRILIVPPSLGYGSSPNGDVPGNSTLVFVVDVLSVTATA